MKTNKLFMLIVCLQISVVQTIAYGQDNTKYGEDVGIRLLKANPKAIENTDQRIGRKFEGEYTPLDYVQEAGIISSDFKEKPYEYEGSKLDNDVIPESKEKVKESSIKFNLEDPKLMLYVFGSLIGFMGLIILIVILRNKKI